MREEILVALVMLGILLLGGLLTKNRRTYTPLILLLSAIGGSLAAGMGLRFREIVEGPFGFLDAMLIVLCGMVFLRVLEDGGALALLFDRISRLKNRAFRAFFLLLFMALPGIISGSALAGIIISGPYVSQHLKTGGMKENRAAAFIILGAFLGMMLPPAAIPAMVAANGAGSVLPTPYQGFFLPLLALGLPAFLVTWLLFAKRLGDMPKEPEETAHAPDRARTAPLSLIPLLGVLLAALVGGTLGRYLYLGGLPLIYLAGSLLSLLLPARKRSLKEMVASLSQGAWDLLLPVAAVFALGAVIEVSSMTGLRGLYSSLILPYSTTAVMLVLMGLMLPAGLFLAFPLAGWMAAYAVFPIGWMANVVVVAGCSASLGVALLLPVRGGMLEDVKSRLSLEITWGRMLSGAWLPLAVLLLTGVLLVVFGQHLGFLIV